jgi:hypothetical protein
MQPLTDVALAAALEHRLRTAGAISLYVRRLPTEVCYASAMARTADDRVVEARAASRSLEGTLEMLFGNLDAAMLPDDADDAA